MRTAEPQESQASPSELAATVGRGGYPGKRILDLIIAASALVATFPILIAAAIAVRLESSGAVIYKHQRVGKNGRQFTLYKLRTMVAGAERMGTGLIVEEGDSRITRVGTFLRRTSIDELPNFVNVLRGEMSIVGPRPTVQEQVDRYTERQLTRLAAKPGITGLAQVQGRAALPWSERIELDIDYIHSSSLRADLRILMQTLTQLLRGDDIYRGDRGGWRS